MRNVGLVPASDEVAVEVDHDHPPVVSLKHSMQSCKESGREKCVSTVDQRLTQLYLHALF